MGIVCRQKRGSAFARQFPAHFVAFRPTSSLSADVDVGARAASPQTALCLAAGTMRGRHITEQPLLFGPGTTAEQQQAFLLNYRLGEDQ